MIVLVALLALKSMEVFSQQQSAAAPAAGSPTFDGTWTVALSCPDFRQGTRLTKGYTYQFLVQVTGGILHGQHGTEGAPSWLRLDGTILPDGTANLTAQGLTGEPEYTV